MASKACTAWNLRGPSSQLEGEERSNIEQILKCSSECQVFLDKLIQIPFLIQEFDKDQVTFVIRGTEQDEVAQVEKVLQENFTCARNVDFKQLDLQQRLALSDKSKQLMQVASIADVAMNSNSSSSISAASRHSAQASNVAAEHRSGSCLNGSNGGAAFDNEVFFVDEVLATSSSLGLAFARNDTQTFKAELDAELESLIWYCDRISTGFRMKIMKPANQDSVTFKQRMDALQADLATLFRLRRPSEAQRVAYQGRLATKKNAEKRILSSNTMADLIARHGNPKMARRGTSLIIREQEQAQLEAGWTSRSELAEERNDVA